ncbi:MAG: hypothetical protein ACYDBJ_00890 [Aggregatilineales bacterium]
MSNADEYRNFILTADTRALIHQLNLDIKGPLASAHAILGMLAMVQNPSPAMQRKIQSGEINPAQLIQQATETLNQALDVIDFYRDTLDAG